MSKFINLLVRINTYILITKYTIGSTQFQIINYS